MTSMVNDPEQNKQTAQNFYDLMFNQCRPREAIEKYAGDEYIQLCLLRTPSMAQSLMFLRSGSTYPTPMLHLVFALLATASSPRNESRMSSHRQRT